MKISNKRILALNIILLIVIGLFLNPIANSIIINKDKTVDEFYNKNIRSTKLGPIGNRILFAYIELIISPNTTTKISYRYENENPPIIIGLGINTDENTGEIDQTVARLKVNSIVGKYESVYLNHFETNILFITGTSEGIDLPTDNDGFYIEGYCFLINIG
jgi:hypothetical protein